MKMFVETKKIIFRTALFSVLATAGHLAAAQQNTLTAQEKKEGWNLLFDGKTTRGWKGAFLDHFPQKGWKIEDGLLLVDASTGGESTNGGDIITEEDYADFELTVDFRLSKGANSGIKYFVDASQPRPADPRSAFGLEFQLLDDAEHPDAKMGKEGNRTLASLYDLIPAPAGKPAKRIGEWNTARILSRGHHVEHWLNGVKVLQYERGSDEFRQLVAGSKYRNLPGFGLQPKGRILLQDHGNSVAFRNVKIRRLPPAAAAATALPDKLGIVSYTYRNSFQKDFAATLDTIRNLGFRHIEFSNLFGIKAEAIRAMLDERGLRCTSFGVSMNDALHKTDEVAANALALGAQYVRVAYLPHEGAFTLEQAQKAVADFNTIGKKLKETYGLRFCYHNHGYEFSPYGDGTLFDYIIQNTDPAYVSFELDILWTIHPGHDPVALLKKYGSRFPLMHVKDLKKGVKGDLSGNTPQENDVALGTGQMNLPAVLKAAQKAGVRFYYIEDESPLYGEQVPASVAYLKSIRFL